MADPQWLMGALAADDAYRGVPEDWQPPAEDNPWARGVQRAHDIEAAPSPALPPAPGWGGNAREVGGRMWGILRQADPFAIANRQAYGVPPAVPGMISDDEQTLANIQADQARDWGPSTALTMVADPFGVKRSIGAPGVALGSGAGSRIIQPQPMSSLADASKYIQPGETRVSTRFPTAVGATEDPLKQHLSIGLEEMKVSPGYEKNINVLSGYPGFAHLEAMGTDEAARAYIRQAAGNLDYLYRRSPEVMKQRSPLWYEGAHEISDALAKRWGVPRPSSSAALASLSPQMDWFKNASLGERTGDIMTSAAAGRPMTSEMEAVARSPRLANLFGGERTGELNREMLRSITGKTFDQLDKNPLEQALWLRLRDEAHNPRPYRTITPEGNFGDFVVNNDGSLANVGWGGLGEIRKAITSLKSGGDMNIISPALGNMHKVRSFYNNIENPHYPLFGDVTADTHQVAGAQLRPLAGSSPAVEHNLSGSMGASSSALSGVRGTYGLTADATRMMAAEHGLLPRAGQSATWEPVRELFTKEWKTPANANKVDDIWRAYDRGDISIDQARDAIFETAGGIGTPSWARPGLRVSAPTQGSTYR